jgi:hypothetical protein
LAKQVGVLAFVGQNRTVFPREGFHNGAANHAIMAGYIDPFAG